MKKLLFVCMGNICRSPAADIVMTSLVKKEGLEDQFEVDSAGTIGFHEGKGPDPRMSRTLEARGYEVFGRSRPVRVEDFDEFDLILAADCENVSDLERLARTREDHEKIRLLCDYAENHDESEVPDPYYGGDAGFEYVADLVEDACTGLVAQYRARE